MSKSITLKINMDQNNGEFIVFPTVITERNNMTLVDCGVPNCLSIIEQAMIEASLDVKQLKQIVITHHDHDHMGSLQEFVEKYPDIKVFCHKDQAPYITGKAKSLRLLQAEEREVQLTEDEKVHSKFFMDYLASIQTVSNVTKVVGNEYLPLYEDVKIIDTSGHMPGHISLYLTEEKTLIAGDAMVATNNELCIANPQYTLDMKGALESIKSLLNYDIQKVICYHGGEVTGDIRRCIEEMLRNNDIR